MPPVDDGEETGSSYGDHSSQGYDQSVIQRWARALWTLPILAACDVFLILRGHWVDALIASAGVVVLIALVMAVAAYQRLDRRH